MREPIVHLPSIPTFSSFVLPPLSALLLVTAAYGASNEPDLDFNIPPTLLVPNIVEGGSYNRDVYPRIVIRSRNLKKSSVTLNGTPYSIDTPIVTEGKHTLTISAEDENNTSAQLKVTFIVDKSPPVTYLAISGSIQEGTGPFFVTGRSEISVSAKDTGAEPSGIQHTECRMDGGERQPYTKPIALSALDDGTHILYCSSTDRAGNSEEEKKLTFTICSYPPSTVVTLSPPNKPLEGGGFLASPSTVFSLFASGSPSGIATTEYQIDGGPWIAYAPFSIAQEGEHIIRFKSTDKLGNIEPLKSVKIVIDQKPPTTSLQIGEPRYQSPNNRLFVSAATLFKINAVSPVIGIAKTEYRIDNRRWTDYAPFSIPDEGKHLVEYRSIDAVGNVEQLHSQHLTVDATPPLTTLSIDGQRKNPEDILFSRGTNTITLSAADKLSGVEKIEYRLDGKEWKPYSPLQLTVTKPEKLEFRSTDNVANEEEIKTLTIKMDPVPPVSTIEIGMPRVMNEVMHVSDRTPFTISATDGESGVDSTEYKIDSGPWLPYSPFTLKTPGKHVIGYRSSDKAGNQESQRSLAVVVDVSSPVTIISIAGKPVTSTGPVFLNGKEPLELKGISAIWQFKSLEYRLDEGEWNEYRSPIFLKEEGEYLLQFRSTDTGGNEEEMRSITLIVDTEPPESSITVGSPKHELDGVLHIETGTVLTPAAVDDLSGVERVEYQLKGHTVEADSIPFSIATKGTYELAYWSIDKAGNKESPKKMKLVVSQAPTKFSPEDLLLGNEIASPQLQQTEKPPVIVQTENKSSTIQADALPDPPPEIIETVRPQQPTKKSFLDWTMGALQILLILGVMAL